MVSVLAEAGSVRTSRGIVTDGYCIQWDHFPSECLRVGLIEIQGMEGCLATSSVGLVDGT